MAEITDDYTRDTPGFVPVGGTLTGRIEVINDRDYISFPALAGRTYLFLVEGARFGGGTISDVTTALYRADGSIIGNGPYASIVFTANRDGDHAIEIFSYSTGTYRAKVLAAPPDGTPGTSGADYLGGTQGDDKLNGLGGADIADGFQGTDTYVLPKPSSEYLVARAPLSWRIIERSGENATATLFFVERLEFPDQTFDLVAPDDTADSPAPAYGQTKDFLFDPVFYALNYSDSVPGLTVDNARQHYRDVGATNEMRPNGWFDADYYANRWDDLRPLNLDDATLFLHYNLYGVWEGRSASPRFHNFDGNAYLNQNRDVGSYVDAYINDFLGSRTNGAIAHYVIYGSDEGRAAFDTTGRAVEMDYVVDLGG